MRVGSWADPSYGSLGFALLANEPNPVWLRSEHLLRSKKNNILAQGGDAVSTCLSGWLSPCVPLSVRLYDRLRVTRRMRRCPPSNNSFCAISLRPSLRPSLRCCKAECDCLPLVVCLHGSLCVWLRLCFCPSSNASFRVPSLQPSLLPVLQSCVCLSVVVSASSCTCVWQRVCMRDSLCVPLPVFK